MVTADEEAGSQDIASPVPKSKVAGRRMPEGHVAETALSPESDRTDRSDASASPVHEVELDRQRRPPRELESDAGLFVIFFMLLFNAVVPFN